MKNVTESNENELVVDYGYLFMTHALFESKEELINWVHQLACSNDMGNVIDSDGHWELKVVHGTHNHPIGQYLGGHSFAGRLTPTQDAFVLNLSKVNSQPIQILDALKKEWPNTKATLRHIYNTRLKHRFVERKGQSQMQYLMTKLKDERFQTDYSKNSKSSKVVDYCMNQWITPYKEKFVSAYTNKIMHYDNVTTNRVESNHAKLKRFLRTSQGEL
ncbi:hypothetical protein ACS0TY_036106 [Phlomoides rotata]